MSRFIARTQAIKQEATKGGIGCVVIFPSNLPLSTASLLSFTEFYMRSP
jgi:hypothetical protein